jgi:hypothetical protein
MNNSHSKCREKLNTRKEIDDGWRGEGDEE